MPPSEGGAQPGTEPGGGSGDADPPPHTEPPALEAEPQPQPQPQEPEGGAAPSAGGTPPLPAAHTPTGSAAGEPQQGATLGGDAPGSSSAEPPPPPPPPAHPDADGEAHQEREGGEAPQEDREDPPPPLGLALSPVAPEVPLCEVESLEALLQPDTPAAPPQIAPHALATPPELCAARGAYLSLPENARLLGEMQRHGGWGSAAAATAAAAAPGGIALGPEDRQALFESDAASAVEEFCGGVRDGEGGGEAPDPPAHPSAFSPVLAGMDVREIPPGGEGTALLLAHAENFLRSRVRRSPMVCVPFSAVIQRGGSLYLTRELPAVLHPAGSDVQCEAQGSDLLKAHLRLAGCHMSDTARSCTLFGGDGMAHCMPGSLKGFCSLSLIPQGKPHLLTPLDCAVYTVVHILCGARGVAGKPGGTSHPKGAATTPTPPQGQSSGSTTTTGTTPPGEEGVEASEHPPTAEGGVGGEGDAGGGVRGVGGNRPPLGLVEVSRLLSILCGPRVCEGGEEEEEGVGVGRGGGGGGTAGGCRLGIAVAPPPRRAGGKAGAAPAPPTLSVPEQPDQPAAAAGEGGRGETHGGTTTPKGTTPPQPPPAEGESPEGAEHRPQHTAPTPTPSAATPGTPRAAPPPEAGEAGAEGEAAEPPHPTEAPAAPSPATPTPPAGGSGCGSQEGEAGGGAKLASEPEEVPETATVSSGLGSGAAEGGEESGGAEAEAPPLLALPAGKARGRLWRAVAACAAGLCSPLLATGHAPAYLCDADVLREAAENDPHAFLSRVSSLVGLPMAPDARRPASPSAGSGPASPVPLSPSPSSLSRIMRASTSPLQGPLDQLCDSLVFEQKASILRQRDLRSYTAALTDCLVTRCALRGSGGIASVDIARLLALLADCPTGKNPPLGLQGALDSAAAYVSLQLFLPTAPVLRLQAEHSVGGARLPPLRGLRDHLALLGDDTSGVSDCIALALAALTAAPEMGNTEAAKLMCEARSAASPTTPRGGSGGVCHTVPHEVVSALLLYWGARGCERADVFRGAPSLLSPGFAEAYDFSSHSPGRAAEMYLACARGVGSAITQAQRGDMTLPGELRGHLGVQAHHAALRGIPEARSVLAVLQATVGLCMTRLVALSAPARGALLLVRCAHSGDTPSLGLLDTPLHEACLRAALRLQRVVRSFLARRTSRTRLARQRSFLVAQLGGPISPTTRSSYIAELQGSATALRLLYAVSPVAARSLHKVAALQERQSFCAKILQAYARGRTAQGETRRIALTKHAAAFRVQKCGRALAARLHAAEGVMVLRLQAAVGVVQRSARRYNARCTFLQKRTERDSRLVLNRVGRGCIARAGFMEYTRQLLVSEEVAGRGGVEGQRAAASLALREGQRAMFLRLLRRSERSEKEERVRIEEGIKAALRTDIAAYHQYTVKVNTIRTHFPPLNAEEKVGRSRIAKEEHKACRTLHRDFTSYYAHLPKRRLQCLIACSLGGAQTRRHPNLRSLALAEGYSLGEQQQQQLLSPRGVPLLPDGSEVVSPKTPLLGVMYHAGGRTRAKSPTRQIATRIMLHAGDKAEYGMAEVDRQLVEERHRAAQHRTHSLRRQLDRGIREEVFRLPDSDGAVPPAAHGQWEVGGAGQPVFTGNASVKPEGADAEGRGEQQLRRAAPLSEVEAELLASWAPPPPDAASPSYQQMHREVLAEIVGAQAQSELAAAVSERTAEAGRSVQQAWQCIGGQSATRIQAVYRGYALRKRFDWRAECAERWAAKGEQLEMCDRHAASCLVQKRSRGVLDRKYAAWYRQEKPVAARCLQRLCRGYLVRGWCQKKKRDMRRSVLRLESWWQAQVNIRAARSVMEQMREKRLLFLMQQDSARQQRRWQATRSIQRFYRAVRRRRRLVEFERIQLHMRRLQKLPPHEMFTIEVTPYVRDVRAVRRRLVESRKLRRYRGCSDNIKFPLPAQRLLDARRVVRAKRVLVLNVQRARLSADRAARRLQSFWRGVRARRVVQRYRRAVLCSCALIRRVQTGACDRLLCAALRHQVRTVAATKIQSAFIGWRHRRSQSEVLVRKRVERRLVVRESAAVTIQAVFKGHRDRIRFREEKAWDADRKHLARMQATAHFLQRWVRGCLSRKRISRLHRAAHSIQIFYRHVLRHREFVRKQAIRHRAAQRIQLMVRNDGARKTIRALRQQREARSCQREQQELVGHAAVQIQRVWRGAAGRKRAKQRQHELHLKYINTNALIIQTCWRRHSAMKEYSDTRSAQLNSAVAIQAMWKGTRQRKAFNSHKVQREASQQAAAHTIQRFSRVAVAKGRTRRKRVERDLRENQLRANAAVHTLQRIGHGYAGRRTLKNQLRTWDRCALNLQRMWVGCIIRFTTRPLLVRRKACALRIQCAWKGHCVRKITTPLLRERRRRQSRIAAWECDVYQLFREERSYITHMETQLRDAINAVSDETYVALLRRSEEDRNTAYRARQRAAERLAFRELREETERENLSAIDEVALVQWRRDFTLREAQRLQQRASLADEAVLGHSAIASEESEVRDALSAQSDDLCNDACLREWRRLWVSRQEAEAEEVRRKREEEESGLTPAELCHKRRLEQYAEERKLSLELAGMERARRAHLPLDEKCNEFRMNYFARRLREVQEVQGTAAAQSKGSHPPRAATRQGVRQPVGDAYSAPFVPLNSTYPGGGVGATRAAAPRLAHTVGTASDAKKLVEMDPLITSLVPLKPFAAEWLLRRECEASSRTLASSQSSGMGGADERTPVQRVYNLPGSRSAKGRVQSVLPALASNDPGLSEVDLNGARLTDVHLHSLLSALKGNTVCRSIKLDENHLNDTMAAQVAQVLAMHPSIRVVSLKSNSITDAGVAALINAVRKNHNLQRIDLGGNVRASAAALNRLESAIDVSARFNATVQQPLAMRHLPPLQHTVG